jgi:hypothetical protein
MNLVEVELAIIDRLSASPIVPAAQSAWNTAAPDDVVTAKGTKPLIIMTTIPGSFGETTFENNVADQVYQVSIHDVRTNGIAPGMDVWTKVFGDSQGTDNAPIYGLQRWKMTGLADGVATSMEALNNGTLHTATHYHWWITFGLRVEEA